jgi:hypothetical protein
MIGMSDDWTVERHLKDKPAEVVALYERFIAIATRCGPFTYAVAKTAITLKGSRRGCTSPYGKGLFVHQFRVTHLDQLDDEFATWIAEAYQVGQGAHLNRPPVAGCVTDPGSAGVDDTCHS